MNRGMTPAQVEDLLYKRSGLLGISGVSNDVRDLLRSDNPLAAEAIEFFVYRVVREIGSLTAALGGLDALIFTAGVGENSPLVRAGALQTLGFAGVELDPERNAARERGIRVISTDASAVTVLVVPTNEELEIARQALARAAA